ncbi:uncharacterized protein LOC113584711 isoform X1 [Electrophorus electricus]|uniref:uncharacterized protein LOC113584711 isoform X1 n=1 Tax=Electrophorus electricus TaxID=8005 RepID=UPI0015CFFC03|nr:uncharacterized protein LOC113584711 isoform X1 [Electrophorus electricus]
MARFLCITFLVITLCGNQTGSSAGVISQLESTVRVNPGLPTTLWCYIKSDVHFSILWMKIPLNKAPVCIATAQALADGVEMYEQFKDHSRISATWDKNTFNLSFSSVEIIDSATYLCGAYIYKKFFFGKGSKLIIQEYAEATTISNTTADTEEKKRKSQILESLLPALVATNVASIFVIILLCHLLAKKKSGVNSSAGDNNYSSLTSGQKQRRTVKKMASAVTSVLYGAV